MEDDHDNDFEREEMVLRCGYPGCCMPGYHFRHECHNVEDLMRLEKALERVVQVDAARIETKTHSQNAHP